MYINKYQIFELGIEDGRLKVFVARLLGEISDNTTDSIFISYPSQGLIRGYNLLISQSYLICDNCNRQIPDLLKKSGIFFLMDDLGLL